MVLESIGQALNYIIECFRMVLEDPKLLVPSFVAVILGAFIGIAVVIASFAFNIFSQSGLSPFFAFFVLIALACSFMVNYLFTAMASFAIYEHVKYGHSSLTNALKRATARWHIILGLAVIAALVSFAANNMKNNRRNRRRGVILGILTPIIGEVLEEGWKIASMLLIPVAVIGGLGFVDTFKKAFDIAKNNLVLIGSGEVGIRILTGIFGFLGVVVSVLMAIGLYILLAGLNMVLAIAVAVVFAFMAISCVTTINQFVRISFYTLAYAWSEERLEHGTPTATAPLPLKNAFGV